jgi:hypothetical protein
LTVASWTESFADYDLASGAALVIEWESPSGKSVHLRAQGMRRRLYFRGRKQSPAAPLPGRL